MKRALKALFFCSTLISSSFALEFGVMGNQSFGMAGTGVAVKKSSWGLYYNPALIAANSGFKLGITAQLHAKNQNFFELFDRDFSHLSPSDLSDFKNLLENNHIQAGNQDGIILQFPDIGIGALALGGFLNLKAQGKTIMTLPPNGFSNIEDLQMKTNFSTLALLEVPIGYAYEFRSPIGEISIGAAVKYMNLFGAGGNFTFSNETGLWDSFKDLLEIDFQHNASNIGIDVGLVYEPVSFLTFGVVGKNLNSPVFNLGFQKFKIDPQARAGAAINVGFWTLAFDADLTKNKVLGSDFSNQMLSLGTSFDFNFFSMRAGVATDLQNKDDLLFGLGVGIAMFDLGVQFGKKTSSVSGYAIPDYLALQLGLGFSF